ncbi:MAG: DUF2971 domain-containing protein [Nitrososphaera sp.]
MHISHPAFTLPLDLDSKIWQYMELAEFVSMLHRKALFFVKANKLRDPYEGIIPQFNNVLTSTIHAIEREKEKEKQGPYNADKHDLVSPSIPQTMIQQFRVYRELVLINPWHYNEYESAAMWNLYSHENAGIAIQSTTRRLSECFKENNEDSVLIGKVKYLDFSKDWMNEWKDDLLQAFVTKRKSFEYENEIRAVTCLPLHDEISISIIAKSDQGKKVFSNERAINSQELTDKGKYVRADLQSLVEKVYVAPYAESWFEEVVQSLLSKYGLDAVVTKSDLYTIS